MVDALPLGLLHPHVAAAGPAAEGVAPVPLHLHRLQAQGGQHRSRLAHDVVVPRQVAGVVIGDGEPPQLLDGRGRELPFRHQPGEELGVVYHLEAAVQLRVFVTDGVEAVGAVGDDLPDAFGLEGLDVLLGLHLEEVFVAQAAGGVAGAGLLRPQHAEGDPRLQQQAHDGLGDLHVALLQGAGAAHPVEVFLGAVEEGHLDALPGQLLDPGGAGELGAPPGVPPLLQLHEGGLGRVGHVGLFHHQVAAHVHQLGDVLDEQRALVFAGAAGDAVPDGVERDHVAGHGALVLHLLAPAPGGQEPRPRLRQVALDVLQEAHGRQLLARVVGRAMGLAAAAADAHVHVHELLPGEVAQVAGAEALGRLEVGDGRQGRPRQGGAGGRELAQEDVGRPQQYVRELAVAHPGHPAGGQPQVQPPEALVEQLHEPLARPRLQERLADEEADGRPRRPVGVGGNAAVDVNGRSLQLGHAHPQPLDDEAGEQDGQHEPQQGHVVPEAAQAHLGVLPQIAPVEGHQDADGGGHPGQVQGQRIAQVDVPLQELHEVVVEGQHDRADEQERPPPEDEQVHQPGVEVVGQPPLPHAVEEEEAHPLPGPVPARLLLPQEPQAQSRQGAVGQHQQDEGGEGVDEDPRPLGDVEEDLAGGLAHALAGGDDGDGRHRRDEGDGHQEAEGGHGLAHPQRPYLQFEGHPLPLLWTAPMDAWPC